ncbi:MAG: SprT-like domain-containing protein [Phycisphaerae bacterium]|nr:SprT-like domain-containing protein [Phycisphaerae bacterium]
MDAKTNCMMEMDRLWSPEQSLPTRHVLREMVGFYGRAWGHGDLARRVRVVYNARLSTTLGRAIFQDMLIELNPRLLAEHPAELVPTLGHELAHLVVHLRYGRCSPHGREFKTLMRAVQLPAKATHNLPVKHLRRKRGKYLYLHRCCDCGTSFVARSVRRQYYCIACGPDMKWDIFRVPNSPAGQMLLDHLRNGK